MHRRLVIVSGLAAAAATSRAFAQDHPDDHPGGPIGTEGPPPDDSYQRAAPAPSAPQGGPQGPHDGDMRTDTGPSERPVQPFTKKDIGDQISDFFGTTAENAGNLVERLFKDNGQPTAYIAGIEGSGAFFFGLRYGKGLMYMKDRPQQQIYWQGPTGGFDWGGNGARVFTLCYNLEYPDAIFRRFPGVDGSAYLIGGLGVNYQHADGITLAPIRAGVGLRIGASLGYLAYSRQRNVIPL